MTQRDKLHSVVGYICSQDIIHSRIIYWDDVDFLHKEVFPDVQFMRKTWRYCPDFKGLTAYASPVDLTDDDFVRVTEHLLKKLNWDELPL